MDPAGWERVVLDVWCWSLNHTHPGLAAAVFGHARDHGVSLEEAAWSTLLCLAARLVWRRP